LQRKILKGGAGFLTGLNNPLVKIARRMPFVARKWVKSGRRKYEKLNKFK